MMNQAVCSNYFIALEKGFELYKKNPRLYNKVQKENYVFVFQRPVDEELNGCFVYDSPKFVSRDDTGRTTLTGYALEHLKECCLLLPEYMPTGTDA